MKAELFAHCHDFIAARVSRIKQNLNSLRESLDSETRSSAGDKYETGRAMVQLEQEKLGQQLLEARRSLQQLKSVDIEGNTSRAHPGSLVHTTKSTYFLALSAGIFINGNTRVYCISPGTPMGKLLLGKVVGDTILFNSEEIRVVSIQ